MSSIENVDLIALAKVIAKRKDVLLAYLFGSRAISRGAIRPSRDIDIAVLFDHSPLLRELLSLRADLTQLLETDNVDLVSLNEASPLLKYEVITGGQTIYSRNTLFQSKFEMAAISYFLDTQYLRNVQNHYLLEGGV